MLTSRLVAAGLLALDLAGPVLARETLVSGEEIQFEQFDLNWDGFLSRDEVAPAALITARFERFDLNRDGRLDRGEFCALLASLKMDLDRAGARQGVTA